MGDGRDGIEMSAQEVALPFLSGINFPVTSVAITLRSVDITISNASIAARRRWRNGSLSPRHSSPSPSPSRPAEAFPSSLFRKRGEEEGGDKRFAEAICPLREIIRAGPPLSGSRVDRVSRRWKWLIILRGPATEGEGTCRRAA